MGRLSTIISIVITCLLLIVLPIAILTFIVPTVHRIVDLDFISRKLFGMKIEEIVCLFCFLGIVLIALQIASLMLEERDILRTALIITTKCIIAFLILWMFGLGDPLSLGSVEREITMGRVGIKVSLDLQLVVILLLLGIIIDIVYSVVYLVEEKRREKILMEKGST